LSRPEFQRLARRSVYELETALQAAYTDTGDYRRITIADLTTDEPGIDWIASGSNLVSTSPAWIASPLGASDTSNQVAFFPQSPSVADLASVSESGNSFGIQIDVVSINETGYVKVKVVDGSAGVGW
jgi:hypothetical protein